MLYSNINLSKIYELSSGSGMVESKLFAFPIDDATKAQLESFITKGAGTWKSTTPLNSMGSDGSIGITGSINGKPAYLWINVSKTKAGQLELELEDRSYLILDTTPENLKNLLNGAEGIDNRKRTYVKNQEGKELSLELWHDIKKIEPVETGQDLSDVKADLEIAQEYPGTAPISGTVAESMINEQKPDHLMPFQPDNPANKVLAKKLEVQKSTEPAINSEQTEVLNALIGSKKSKDSKGNPIVYAESSKDGYSVYFYNNGKVMIKTKEGKYLYGKYSNGGRAIQVDNGPKLSKADAWETLWYMNKHASKSSPGSNTESSPINSSKEQATGFDQAKGDAFRQWANSTDELKKKYGKQSEYDLDATGMPDNSYIRKAYAAAKEEYSKYLESKTGDATKTDSKFKIGDVVYYKINSKDGTAATASSNGKKLKFEPSDRELAYAKVGESIITKFEDYVSVSEETDGTSSEVDAQMLLIKDVKSGNIKKGVITQITSNDDIKVQNTDTKKLDTIKSSDIVSSDVVQMAQYYISKEKPEDETSSKTPEETTKSKFKSEKDETRSLKQDLKQAKKEKKEAKKNIKADEKFTKKSEKQEKKQEKISKKIEKVKGETDSVGESVVYNFEEFIKMIKGLN